MRTTSFSLSAVAIAALATTSACWSQGVATETQLLEKVVVASNRTALPVGATSIYTVKASELSVNKNLFNPEDAIENAPSTTLRKRYIGDRNALVSGRSFGTLQPSRAAVYVDGYLISNFLGRFDAPRWNVLSPESLARVDVLHGPFSALLPGNSIGTTVIITQARPKESTVSGRVIGARQRFDQYGHADDFDSSQLSLSYGDRLDGGLWYAVDLNRQQSRSQPMQWATVVADASGNFPVATGPATPVTGIVYDTSPLGAKRAVFGANAGAIDTSRQHTLNMRAGLQLASDIDVSGMVALWHSDSSTRNQTFLRNSQTGAAVWQGKVTDGVNTFNLPASLFAIGDREELHGQWGLTAKAAVTPELNASFVASGYRIADDSSRGSSLAQPSALLGGAGTMTRRDGTGWQTAELQGVWQPSNRLHVASFGFHRNEYKLRNSVEQLVDWRYGAGTLSQQYAGRTEVSALYAQDRWQFHEDGSLTLGMRAEHWRASDGVQIGGGRSLAYPTRTANAYSPKAVMRWNLDDTWAVRGSVGRGVRFPNVEELYNGTVTATSQTLADPGLKPEVSHAVELSVEAGLKDATVSASLFSDDVRDAIQRQSTVDPSACKTASTGATTYTCVQNVDRVRTEGIELTAGWTVKPGLKVDGNLTYTFRSEVTANRRDPAMVGKWWLRVPRVRANAVVSYAVGDSTLSATWRYQGRSYSDPYNADSNPNVYAGVSSQNQVDIRATHRLTRELVAAVGVNNVAARHAFQSHPYPGRTVFAELRFKR